MESLPMSVKDGGAAFPRTPFDDKRTAGGIYGEEGMSLRDYFAAKAMQGMVADQTFLNEAPTRQRIAEFAYRMADMMLAESARIGAADGR